MTVLLVLVALAILGFPLEFGIFAAVNHFNRRAAARLPRPRRLPQQLTTRTQDFDEKGRPW